MKLKLLDSTLRDGGYYNRWDFKLDLVHKLIDSLSQSGIDIVEIGYKSTVEDRYYGLFRYCTESQLQFLRQYRELEYAFMIDAKEFLDPAGKIDETLLFRMVAPQSESIFHWCRIATHYQSIREAAKLTELIHQRGYKVCINLMGISLLNDDQLTQASQIIASSSADVFYFADSFGSFSPKDIKELVRNIRNHYTGALGIHTHDNQGLAFANTITAIDEGVEYIDSTITGMGRGAGNLKLEQLLLALYFKFEMKHLNPYCLLDLVQNDFKPLQEVHQWGWDFSYMLSGLKNIHPDYCQKLKSSQQYTITQVAEILKAIPDEYRSKYSAQQLTETSNHILETFKIKEIPVTIPKYEPEMHESILIVGGGSSVKRDERAIESFILKYKPVVIDCNDQLNFPEVQKTVVALNQVRLSELIRKHHQIDKVQFITGFEKIPEALHLNNMKYIPFKIQSGTFQVEMNQIVIPSYIVGMFALGIALLCKPKKIYLVGFDGYSNINSEEHQEMQQFWKLVKDKGVTNHVQLISILPTQYEIKEVSIYKLLSQMEGD